MQFLMGLNNDYVQVRSQILAMKPMPSLNLAYAIIVVDESHRVKKVPYLEASAMLTGPANSPNSTQQPVGNEYNQQMNTRNKKRPQCTHCQGIGHYKETCYKLVGYPLDTKIRIPRGLLIMSLLIRNWTLTISLCTLYISVKSNCQINVPGQY